MTNHTNVVEHGICRCEHKPFDSMNLEGFDDAMLYRVQKMHDTRDNSTWYRVYTVSLWDLPVFGEFTYFETIGPQLFDRFFTLIETFPLAGDLQNPYEVLCAHGAVAFAGACVISNGRAYCR